MTEPLKVGDCAPPFSLPDATGNPVSLGELLGKWVVLYFYPRDNTPGCTTEAQAFRDAFERFEEQGSVILGVSTDDVRSHRKFSDKHGLPFALLADTEGMVARAYGVWGEKKFMGRTTVGIRRSTFVIDPEGKVAYIFSKVKPETHPTEVLMALGAKSSSDGSVR